MHRMPRHRAIAHRLRRHLDLETRERIFEAGMRLFPEYGFHRVTVRDICREAHANLAAVSYHFGDKLGLYLEVVQAAIDVMRKTDELARLDGASWEEKLRGYVRRYIQRLAHAQERGAWIHRLMSHEQADPTPAASLIAEQVLRPRIDYLMDVVAGLLQCSREDHRVLQSVASIHAQCIVAIPNPFRVLLLTKMGLSLGSIDQLADHIVEFSLAGIRGLADPPTP